MPGGHPLQNLSSHGHSILNSYDHGMSATHEIGHWLGLMHPFTHPARADGTPIGDPCHADDIDRGDHIVDTPPQWKAWRVCARPIESYNSVFGKAAIAALILHAAAVPIIPITTTATVETSLKHLQHLADGDIANQGRTQVQTLHSSSRNVSSEQGSKPAPHTQLAKRSLFSPSEDELRLVMIHEKLNQHNVTDAQLLTATTPKPNCWLKLTDAQVDAIIAANEASLKSGEDYRVMYEEVEFEKDYHLPDYAGERKHLDQINRVLLANLTLPEIHDLFHSEGQPITLTDEQVDAALSSHYARTESTAPVFCGEDVDGCTEGVIRFQELHEQFNRHNVTEGQIATAIKPQFRGQLINLSNAQVDAIAAADEAPVSPIGFTGFDSAHRIADYPKERKHLDQINSVLLANLTLPESHTLFHSKDGQAINLADEEVDAALSAHYGATSAHYAREYELNKPRGRTEPQQID